MEKFEEFLDYEYDKENDNIPVVTESKPSVKESKQVKHNKKELQRIYKQLNGVKHEQEKIMEGLVLKALSGTSSTHTPTHRPAKSYSWSRKYSSPYSWSAKK